MSEPQSNLESEGSVEAVVKATRFSLILSKSRFFSYADLLEEGQKENEQEISASSSTSRYPEHDFPVFMQNILERLEKYGQLAPRKDIGFHSKSRKHEKSNEFESEGQECEEDAFIDNYDLDDKFIDDGEINCESGHEEEFDKDFKFYVETDVKNITNLPQKRPRKPAKKNKPKTPCKIDYQREISVNFENLPEAIKEQMVKLKGVYEDSRKNGAITKSMPKGVTAVLTEIYGLMRLNDIRANNLYKIIADMNSVKINVIERAMNKISKQKEKAESEKIYIELKNKLKDALVIISKEDNFNWTDELRSQLRNVLASLQEFVIVHNEYQDLYIKKNPQKLKYEDEEKVVVSELKNISNSRLDNVNLKDRIKRIVPEKISSTNSNMLLDLIIYPKIGKFFDSVEFNFEDFTSSADEEIECSQPV